MTGRFVEDGSVAGADLVVVVVMAGLVPAIHVFDTLL